MSTSLNSLTNEGLCFKTQIIFNVIVPCGNRTHSSCVHFQRGFFCKHSTDAYTPAQVSAHVDGLPDCGISFFKSFFSQHNMVIYGGPALFSLMVKSFLMSLFVFPVCGLS
jgi:hypothetical protein